MPFGNRVPDKTLLREINRKLLRTGTQSKITASVKSGYVTLAGTLQYETQRRILIRATKQVNGIRQVTDQMTVRAKNHVG